MLVSYLAAGIAISIATSLVAGVVVGLTMGISGFGSIWVFRAEMLSMFVGSGGVLISQLALVIGLTERFSLRAGAIAGGCFFFVDPVAGVIAVGTAIAIAFGARRLTGKWNSM